MDFHIIEITVDRNLDGTTNIDGAMTRSVVKKYVLPIIEKNVGWGTAHVETDSFFSLSRQEIQNTLDATVGITNYSRCLVAFIDNDPVGLAQADVFTPTDQKNSDHPYMKSLREVTSSVDHYLWRRLVAEKIVDEQKLKESFAESMRLISNNNILLSPGIVIKPILQGKKSGLYELLRKQLKGINIAWTSNPIVVSKTRRLSNYCNFYPLLSESIKVPEEIAMAACIMIDLLNWSNDSWKTMPFGTGKSVYFVQERGDEYLGIAESLANTGSITKIDLDRLRWILGQTGVHGCLASMI